jgi:hypothetical protein
MLPREARLLEALGQKGEGGETREEASSALILGCISLVESEVFG